MTITRLQGKKILIVDDDEDILGSIDLALRAEGAATETVTDGNAAVSACDEDVPDAVVLDMMLPKRSGFLVLEKIKQQAEPPVVVMITANQGKRHMAYAEALGVDAYLVKPVPLQRLVEMLVGLLSDSGRREEGAAEQTR
ncbi:MAG: response regulator transcription factor [Planctomycetota bacterium]|jgi:DNA-binding response OmpR family regulator